MRTSLGWCLAIGIAAAPVVLAACGDNAPIAPQFAKTRSYAVGCGGDNQSAASNSPLPNPGSIGFNVATGECCEGGGNQLSAGGNTQSSSSEYCNGPECRDGGWIGNPNCDPWDCNNWIGGCQPQGGGGGGGPPQGCGDQRDAIIAEYTMATINPTPTCASFSQTAHSTYFTFGELNTGNFSWIIARAPITVNQSAGYGLDRWRFNYGSARIVNSAYRNPVRNAAVGGANASRHMFGDAVDLRNVTQTQAEYDAMYVAAQNAGADYIEPTTLPCGLGCSHADWRLH
jgi:Peptidase M15